MKWIWAVVVLGLIVLGVMMWVMSDMDKKMNETVVKSGLILDWYPEKGGIVLTIAVDKSLYKIHTNATMINVKNPVAIVFRGNTPISIIQEDRAFGIKDWQKLKTLEKMPKVEKQHED